MKAPKELAETILQYQREIDNIKHSIDNIATIYI